MTDPKPSPAWQGLRPTGKTLDNGQPEPGRPIIINCQQTNPENCHEHQPIRREMGGLQDGGGIHAATGPGPNIPGLCAACTTDFRAVLADVPLLLDDLDIAIAGETRFVEHGTRNGTTPSSAGGNQAIAAYERLATALMQIAELLPYVRHRQMPRYLANQLSRNLTQLAHRPKLRTAALDISTAVSRAHKVIDAPPELWFYGACPDCSKDIWQQRIWQPHQNDDTAAAPEPAPVVCPCSYSAPLDEHQRNQIEAGQDRWLTIPELVAVIKTAGETVTVKQIEQWRDHDGLPREARPIARWVSGQLVIAEEVDVFRLGDVRGFANGEHLDVIVTSRQAASQLGITEATVRKLVERGQLTPIRKGAKPLRFWPDELDRYQQVRSA